MSGCLGYLQCKEQGGGVGWGVSKEDIVNALACLRLYSTHIKNTGNKLEQNINPAQRQCQQKEPG